MIKTNDKWWDSGLQRQAQRSFVLAGSVLAGSCLLLLCFTGFVSIEPLLAQTPIFNEHRTFGSALDCTYSLAVGDMDGDGRIDIVSGNTRSLCDQELPLDQQDAVARNQKIGRQNGFFPKESLREVGPATRNTLDTAVGDLNGDGALDLVVGGGYIQELVPPLGEQNYIFLNDGSGNFHTASVNCAAPPANVICFGNPNEATAGVAVGDLNDDGFLDIVTSDVNPSTGRSEIKIFFNAETAPFTGTQVVDSDNASIFDPVIWFALEIALGDMNNDDRLDIIAGKAIFDVFSMGIGGAVNGLYLQGDLLSFGAPIDFGDANDITRGLALGHLDNNNYLDIVEGNGFTFREGDVLYQARPNHFYLNDNGTLTAYDLGTIDLPTLDVAVGDFNHDGYLDITAVNYTTPNEIFFNAGNATFPDTLRQTFGTGADGTVSVETADLNGNGSLDIIIGNIGQNLIYLNEQFTDFPDSTISPFGDADGRTFDVTVADVISQDGTLDIIVVSETESEIYVRQEDGSYSLHTQFATEVTPVMTRTVAAADMNNDNLIDIIVGNWGQPNKIYLNHETTPFQTNWVFDNSNGQTFDLAVADFNGDERLDIVVSNLNQTNAIFLNTADDNFETRSLASNTGKTLGIAQGDIDNDGDTDIAIGNQDFDQQNILYLNDGAGQFPQTTIDCTTSPNPAFICFGDPTDWTISLAMADVNGDASLDIIMGNMGQQNQIYINDSGSFGSDIRLFGTGGDLTYRLATTDANGDGFSDIVTANGLMVPRDPEVPIPEINVVYLNDGNGNYSSGNALALIPANDNTELNPSLAVATGDLDKNGTVDFVFGNWKAANKVFINNRRMETQLSNNPPFIEVKAPLPSSDTDSATSSTIIEERWITIPFTVLDFEGDDIGYAKFYYSQNGGDNWQTAVPSCRSLNQTFCAHPKFYMT